MQLVQSYLRLNGYLTASEYPLVESKRGETPRILTDIDLLAVRFGRTHGGKQPRSRGRVGGPLVTDPDPALRCPADGTDMIIAEVKQGRAFVNPATRNPEVLAAALARFGCCKPDEGHEVVGRLLQHGVARTTEDHTVRMVLFAERGERAPRGWHWVHLDRVIGYVDEYVTSRGDFLGAVDLKDPALGWLSLLRKCGYSLVRADHA